MKTIFIATLLGLFFGCDSRTIDNTTTKVESKPTHEIIIPKVSIPSQKSTSEDGLFPKEAYSIIEAKLENGKPVIGRFNQGYRSYPSKSKYQWCLKVAVELDKERLFRNGLPLPEEKEVANNLQEKLIEELGKLTTTHHIGHLYNDKFLDIYWYVEDPAKVHQWLQAQTAEQTLVRGFGYEINPDPKWQTVRMFLNDN